MPESELQWYWVKVRDRSSGQTLYEDTSIFSDANEALEDINRMIEEGRIPYTGEGYTVDLFDIHPDIPWARPIKRRGVRPK